MHRGSNRCGEHRHEKKAGRQLGTIKGYRVRHAVSGTDFALLSVDEKERERAKTDRIEKKEVFVNESPLLIAMAQALPF